MNYCMMSFDYKLFINDLIKYLNFKCVLVRSRVSVTNRHL